jgi:hypothetical protein
MLRNWRSLNVLSRFVAIVTRYCTLTQEPQGLDLDVDQHLCMTVIPKLVKVDMYTTRNVYQDRCTPTSDYITRPPRLSIQFHAPLGYITSHAFHCLWDMTLMMMIVMTTKSNQVKMEPCKGDEEKKRLQNCSRIKVKGWCSFWRPRRRWQY